MVTLTPQRTRSFKQSVGTQDIVFVTLDTLRYDVAQDQWAAGHTPHLGAHLGARGWEKRHSPGSFTYAAHQAFFAGFLPTPARPGPHPRPFAASFAGSETTTCGTYTFEHATIVEALRAEGYHTACIGGVGFFNKRTAIGRVLPDLFDESHWSQELGVTCPQSTANQFALARDILAQRPSTEQVFLFINVSALHQPNSFYLDGAQGAQDSIQSHAAALRYVDAQWPTLRSALQARAGAHCIVCGDHGTAYGEDGYTGHRLAHDVVMNVPYSAFNVLPHKEIL